MSQVGEPVGVALASRFDQIERIAAKRFPAPGGGIVVEQAPGLPAVAVDPPIKVHVAVIVLSKHHIVQVRGGDRPRIGSQPGELERVDAFRFA